MKGAAEALFGVLNTLLFPQVWPSTQSYVEIPIL